MAWIEPKRVAQIVAELVQFVNDNKGPTTSNLFIDPYQQATGSSDLALAYGDDFKQIAIWPKVHFHAEEISRDFMGGQNKTRFLESKDILIAVYYYCHQNHNYTDRNGTIRQNEAQVLTYLEEMQDTLKANNSAASGFTFHKMRFGDIPQPIWNQDICFSFFPMTVRTYKR